MKNQYKSTVVYDRAFINKGQEWRIMIKRIGKDLWGFKWVIVGIIVLLVALKAIFGEVCPMVIITGFPCPGCGITRATISLLMGRFTDAVKYNPSIFLWVIAGIYFCIQRYIRGRKVKHFNAVLGVVGAICIIIYVIRMILYFPNVVPMVYNDDNVLKSVFSNFVK